jgi:hypothetical protein
MLKDVKLSLPAETGANGLRLIVFIQNPISGHIVAVTTHGVTQMSVGVNNRVCNN